jgi:hypothetical protein
MSLLACVFALHSHSLSLFSSTITAAEVPAKRAYLLKTDFACEGVKFLECDALRILRLRFSRCTSDT